MPLPEDVPNDLLYMHKAYDWLYSKHGLNLVAAADKGDDTCKELLRKLTTHINTIEFWQLNDRFDRAHYEVEQLKKWFDPIMLNLARWIQEH
mgnify:FL=1